MNTRPTAVSSHPHSMSPMGKNACYDRLREPLMAKLQPHMNTHPVSYVVVGSLGRGKTFTPPGLNLPSVTPWWSDVASWT